MRAEFFKKLLELAHLDPNLYLIVGDVGFSVIEEFKQRFPMRYINAGVAEQGMIGLAAGLAMAGKNVYVYSIIPFVTMRCFEQIRDDLCYQELPVKLVGVGGGFSYGPMGVTHHALEDVGILRMLPGMTVVAPGSKYETEHLVPQMHALQGPSYLRLSNNEELVSYPDQEKIILGKACQLIAHEQFCIVASGNALDLAWQVCQYLATQGIQIGLVSLPTIKPLDHEFFLSKSFTAIFSIEEHFLAGGLGQALAHMICQQIDSKVIFHAFGVDDFYFHEAGSRKYLNQKAGLSVEHIASTISKKLERVNAPQVLKVPYSENSFQ